MGDTVAMQYYLHNKSRSPHYGSIRVTVAAFGVPLNAANDQQVSYCMFKQLTAKRAKLGRNVDLKFIPVPPV